MTINKLACFYCLTILLAAATYIQAYAQNHKKEVKAFQKELNREYANPKKSPLPESQLKQFKALPFYPIDETYSVTAQFERVKNPVPITLKTTTSRLPVYDVYGIATFELKGQTYKLNVYQSHSLRETEKYKNYLFLPFTDQTNGSETYGGGRFIDLTIPEGNTIVINFNKAYNPYCAYNHKYSCPVPPQENDLAVEIKAGVKKPSY